MKKALLFLIIINTYIFANINAVVSILPQKTFVEAIGGDKVDVVLMVEPGNSPHTYEPKPSQMKEIAKADIYFTIGVEFEHVWLHRFTDLNAKMKLADLCVGITKQEMQAHGHHDEHDHDKVHEEKKGQSMDPHIWTSTDNVHVIADNIYQTLAALDPVNESYYLKNLKRFKAKIADTDKQIKQILSNTPKGTPFMVFHPAWGYFAKAYGLEQLPVEVEGKEPKFKELMGLIKKAREYKVKAIFTQPEFSDATAQLISKELGIKVIKASPLAADWSENLIKLANAVAGR